MLKMNKSNKFLFLVAYCLMICDFTSAAERKCAEYDEYCQEHWECCSNTCLTYSYRCIGKKRPSFTFERPVLTLDELLESIAEVNMIPANTNKQSQIDDRQKSGITLKTLLNANNEWRADVEEPVLQDRFAAIEGRGDVAGNSSGPDFILFVLQPQDTEHSSKQLQQNTQTAQNSTAAGPTTLTAVYGKETATESDSGQTKEGIQCKEIGVKCYRHEECCTQRCHGFLHQCVT